MVRKGAMIMKTGKAPKDENFGMATSKLYNVFSKYIPSMKSFYSFIGNDIKKRRFKSLLDIGCGPGILDVKLAHSFPESSIYCIDPSQYMLDIASKNAKRLGVENIYFKLGKNTDIPFEKRFDIIITTLSFHHWAVKEKALSYISNYMNSSGSFIIYEFLKPENKRAISGSHSLSAAEANSYSNIPGLKLNDVSAEGKFIRVVFTKPQQKSNA